jgi:hypothetical protein
VDGTFWLLDFGIARHLDLASLTAGDTAGTLELGAWIDLPDDKSLDLSGGAIVRVIF